MLRQSYKNIEMVIINDGSPDNLDEVMKPYLSNPIIKYIKQENTGLGIARNNAVKASTGDWIFILDSDDIIEPDYLKKAVELIENDNDVIYPNPYFFSHDIEIPEKLHMSPWQMKDIKLENSIFGMTTHVSFLVKKDLLIKSGLWEEDRSIQQITDWDIELKLQKIGANLIKFNSKKTENAKFLYRYSNDSMTRTDWKKNHNRLRIYFRKNMHRDIFIKVCKQSFNTHFNRDPNEYEIQILEVDNNIEDYASFLSSIFRLEYLNKIFKITLDRQPNFNELKSLYEKSFQKPFNVIKNNILNSKEYIKKYD